MICGNGVWIQQNTYSTSQINTICADLAAKGINLMYYAAGMWSDTTPGRLGRRNQSGVTTAVNAVHAYNAAHGTQLKILGFIMFNRAEDISNYTQRISDLVSLCNDTGLDGIADDIEQWASNTTPSLKLSYYNGAATALHATSPPRMYTTAMTVDQNDTVYPSLKIDLVEPMFYNGQSTASIINAGYWDNILKIAGCPVSIGIRPDTSSMSSIITAVNAKISGGKPANLAGYSIWSYDSGSMVPSSADWTAWTNWTGKNCTPTSTILTTVAIPTSTSVNIGGTLRLTATCKDQNNVVMTCPTLTWTSSNTAVATVNSAGLVAGIVTGSVNITAKSGSVVSNISVVTVTTTPPIIGNLLLNPGFETGTSGNPDNWTVKTSDGILTPFSFTYPEVGRSGSGRSVAIQRIAANNAWACWLQSVNLPMSISSFKLSGYCKTQNVVSSGWGAYVQIDWYSSTGYISTSFSQKITGTTDWTSVEVVSHPPSGAIRSEICTLLYSTGVVDKAWFDDIYFGDSTSTPALTTITTSPLTASINVGATQQLIATCKDQSTTTMTCPTLTWKSSNTAVATVNSSGLVTGIAVGIANITTSAAGKISNPSSGITVTVGKKFTVQDVMSGTTKIGAEAILDNLGTFTKDQACTEVCNKLGQL